MATRNPIQRVRAVVALVFLLGAASASAVPLVDPWTISGPGTTSSTQTAFNEWALDYSLNGAGFNDVTWTVSGGPVSTDGDYTFDWNYSGFHAFFAVTAFLISSDGTTLVDVGPQNCCTAPSGGFNYNGSYTFAGVSAGDLIGFTLGGSNFDSNNVLSGTLTLTQDVPAPAPLALIGLGLLALARARARS